MKINFLLLFLSLCGISIGQNVFHKTYGGTNNDKTYSVQQTNDGGYIMTGSCTGFGIPNINLYLLKTDVNGDTLWTSVLGGAGNENGRSVQQTNDGGYIVCGSSGSFSSSSDVWMLKTTSSGVISWSKIFGGTLNDAGFSAQQTTDGGYIFAGTSDNNFYLIKTDSDGNESWNKTYGGTKVEDGYFVRQTNDGGYIMIGDCVSFGAGGYDIYVVKADANGNHQWSRTLGGVQHDYGYSIIQVSDGGYLAAGVVTGLGSGYEDAYLAKMNSNGALLWNKTYGSTENEGFNSVMQTSDGGFIAAGYVGLVAQPKDIYLQKVDSDGNPLWSRTYGGTYDDAALVVVPTSDGGFAIGGRTSSYGAGYDDVYLIKADAASNSGCYDTVRVYAVTTPATITTTPVPVISSDGSMSNAASSIGRGATVNTICSASCTITPGISGNNTICSGQNTTLSASGGIFYLWNTGQTQSSIVVAPTANTTYTVTASTATCSGTGTVNVTVVPTPTISTSGNTTICLGDAATLSALGGSSYLWNTSATSSTIIVTPTSNVTYTVISFNGNCPDTASVAVTVSGPTVGLTLVQDTVNPLLWYGYPVINGIAPFTYFWDFGDGNTSTSPNPSHTYSVSGHYPVCLNITDASGCNATTCDSTYKLLITGIIQYLNIINPLVTGVENFQKIDDILIYPNPTKGFFSIKSSKLILSFEINNLLGKLIYSTEKYFEKPEVDFSNELNGVYFIHIRTEEGIVNKTIVINK